MIDPTPQNIRNSVIETLLNEYIGIYGLSQGDREIVKNNLFRMSDIELGKEILLIEEFHSKNNHIYQNALVTIVRTKEAEEESNNKNILINF